MIALTYVHLDDSDYVEWKIVRLMLRIGQRSFLVEAGLEREFEPLDDECRNWKTGWWKPRFGVQTWGER